MPGESFGLGRVGEMWVDGCYGQFRCQGVTTECGFRGAHSPKNCSCDVRCVPRGLRQSYVRGATTNKADVLPYSRALVLAGRYEGLSGTRTLVTMLETRKLSDGPNSRPSQRPWALAAALNEHYARVNGFGFRFYRIKRPAGATADCFLQDRVARAAPWCKILALRAALAEESVEVAVFVDSDAWLRTDGADDRLRATIAQFRMGVECAWFANDAPWGHSRANTGLVLWRRSDACAALLAAWWRVDAAPTQPYYEQSALNVLMQKDVLGATRLIRVLPGLSPLDDRPANQPRSSLHMPHYYASGRWQQMCAAALRLGIGLAPLAQNVRLNATQVARTLEVEP